MVLRNPTIRRSPMATNPCSSARRSLGAPARERGPRLAAPTPTLPRKRWREKSSRRVVLDRSPEGDLGKKKGCHNAQRRERGPDKKSSFNPDGEAHPDGGQHIVDDRRW